MRLDELKGYDEPPTRSASERAKRFVLELAYGLFAGIPSPLVTVAIGQGIDFVWRNGNRHVHVHIPQELSEPIYLYYDDGEEFGTDKNCTAEQVERRVHQYIVN